MLLMLPFHKNFNRLEIVFKVLGVPYFYKCLTNFMILFGYERIGIYRYHKKHIDR